MGSSSAGKDGDASEARALAHGPAQVRSVRSVLAALATVLWACASATLRVAAPPGAPPAALAAPDDALTRGEANRQALAALLAEHWEYYLAREPERASELGDLRYNDRWKDRSAGAAVAHLARSREYLARLQALDAAGLSDQEALTRKLMIRAFEDELEGARFERWKMPVNQVGGLHLQAARLPNLLRFQTAKDFEDWTVRLRALPKQFDHTIANMRLGMAAGLMPPGFLLEQVAAQSARIAAMEPEATPFAGCLAHLPKDLPSAERDRLRSALLVAVRADVLPAYERFARFVKEEYAPRGRAEVGIWTLPDGAARYAFQARESTTTSLTPDEIHALGLGEVARIEGEMLAAARKAGYPDLAAFRAAIAKDPGSRPTSREQILELFRVSLDAMRKELPRLFGRLPKADFVVAKVEEFREKEAPGAMYQRPAPDGSRPGRIEVNTGDFANRKLHSMESTAYHEAVPGHHLQIAIEQELEALPPQRRHWLEYDAYGEGWALYAERLGREVGRFQDPLSYQGHLEAEMLRAVRLVVDTGLHSRRWSRQQVVDYFHAHSAMAEASVQAETDRYIAWPGQALAYKVGQLRILALRERATRELGPAFDLRAFHDELLGGGNLPLDVLEERVGAWITAVKARPARAETPVAAASPPPAPAPVTHAPTPATFRDEQLIADSPRTTLEGAGFIAPAGWSLTVRGAATILGPPEGGSHVALVDVRAPDAAAAVAAAWAAYRPQGGWPLKVTTDAPDHDGWTDIHRYEYLTPPNERRDVVAWAQRAGDVWTVVIHDMTEAVGEKRGAAVSLILGSLLPKGYSRESFAGRKALPLDSARLARLGAWVETAMKELGVPGVALGVVQDGRTVFAEGFGVREMGKAVRPDADTRFMIASNTKALTTLMLAKLVDEGRVTWETPVTSVLPTFRLGDPETTRQVRVKHLVCACTGLPRQDLESIFQFQGLTPAGLIARLATMQPTSRFGEMFQYSNGLAAAGGFVGAHALYPGRELGEAYDEAMRTRVFEPLGMTSTTFDYATALAGNHAVPHAPDIDGRPARAVMEVNYSAVPGRPSAAAWSTVRDLLRYVSLELAEGVLPGGQRYIAREPLLERRVRQASISKDAVYGMGLIVDTRYGIPVVHHGGWMVGFHSDMFWLPEQGVGAVILTNGDPGWILRRVFQRKLLEVLFDGKPEADASVASQARAFFERVAAERRLLTVPADRAEAGKLARRYRNEALGEVAVGQEGGATTFDFGEWKSEVASRRNADGSSSFVTIAPGLSGLEFIVGEGDGRRTLITRDAQHEYVFTQE